MELLIPIDNASSVPMYEQIYLHIKAEIQSRHLPAGRRLPSTRILAENLKVSRSTTQMAYDQLVSEGYIEPVPCRGYFICKMEALVEVKLEQERDFIKQEEPAEGPYRIDFSPRGIELESFPYGVWRKISKDILVGDNVELFRTGDSMGEAGLREVIRSYLHSARGVSCRADQIIIGAGSEYLLMLLCQILGPDNRIAMENPTYRQAYRIFASHGYEVAPVPMDTYGMAVAQLEKEAANIAYTMPAHQYPMGIIMPVKRRQELLKWANKAAGRYLIEDDYDSEFRYRGKPIPALQGMDKNGKVIYIGTFSKSIAPAIRVSYLVLPGELMRTYHERYGFYSSTVSRLDQKVLYEFIAQGHFERHLNRMRAIYKNKHDLLLSELKCLEPEFTVSGENGGLHILLSHRGERSEAELIELAKARGLRVYGLSGYYIHPEHIHGNSTVVLGFANLKEEEIRTGVRILCECWKP